MIRIGKISYWHVHAWEYTNEALHHPGTEITAVWDELPERGREAAGKLGVAFYESLDEMLSSDQIDAVIVDAPTSMHAEVMIAAAKAGKHIFTEKVIAPTLQEVNQILQHVKDNKVKLTVSLPRLNDSYTLAIEQVLEQQLLGQITQVRSRLSHNGATAGWLPEHFFNLQQCGGGALIDLGCHPMYLTRLFMNELPLSVTAQFGYVSGKEVEDNAVALLQGRSGALGIVEAGFVNDHSPFVIEVHGTKGTLLYNQSDDKLLLRSSAEGGSWQERWIELPLPENRENAFTQWVQHIENDTEAEDNIALAVDLTKLMEAATISARKQRAVAITELKS